MLCNVVGQMKGQPKVSFCAGDLILEQFGSSSFTSLCPCFLKSPCGMGLLYLQTLFLSNPLSRPCPQANSKYLTYCPPSPLLCFPFFFLFSYPLLVIHIHLSVVPFLLALLVYNVFLSHCLFIFSSLYFILTPCNSF